MAEFKLGRIRFVWKASWVTGTSYYKDDVVRFGGKVYVCQIGHTASADFNTDLDIVPTKWNLMADGQRWRDEWTTGVAYEEGDLVKYGGTIYVCVDGHISAATATLGLEANSSDWNQFVEGTDWKGVWTVSTRYKLNDIVRYGGINYICITGHTSAATSALGLENGSVNWQVFSQGQEYLGTWSTATRYKLNDVVKYGAGLWICTTQHTAAAAFATDSANWAQYVEGLEYESTWNSATAYQPGDVVKYGGNNYVAKTQHTNSNPVTGTSDWDLFSEGLSYQADWSNATSYKIGEVVKLNGYNYLAIADSPSLTFTVTAATASNDQFTIASTTGIVAGMTVRFTGTTFGGVFTSGRYYVKTVAAGYITISIAPGGTTFNVTADASGSMTATISAEPPNSSYWSAVSHGMYWRGDWADDTEYNIGDTVKYGSNSYICVLAHRGEGDDGSTLGTAGGGQANSRPDLDTTGTYWNVLTIGNELSVLTTVGDMVYQGGAGPTRLPVGTEGQILRVSSTGIPEWVTWGEIEHVYYVSPAGEDRPYPDCGATLDKPWQTIRYACEQVEKGPRNAKAQHLLELNRAFIQKEITAWIRAQISAASVGELWYNFDYDEYKCERDVGFIIDRLIWDIGHGGNLKMRAAAFSLLGAFGEAGEFSAAEESTTYVTLAAEADEGVAAYEQLKLLVADVLANEVPNTVYQSVLQDSTAVVAQYINTDYVAEAGITTTTDELIDIIITALTEQVTTNLPARRVPNNTINIKTGQYRETLPIIVPVETALVGDEKRSVNAGPAGSLVSRDDAKYSIGALGRLETVVGQIILGSNVTESSGNTAVQDIAFPYASSIEVTTVKRLVRTMQHQVDFKLGTMHLESSALPTGYNTSFLSGYGDARKLLKENKEFIKDEITAWIAVNYPTVKYSKTACRRDVGYIVDAVCYDLTYGGSHQTLIAGLAYFDGNASTTLMIDSTEVAATLAAYSRMKTVMQQIAVNTAVTVSAGNTSTQWTDSTNLTSGSSASSQIGSLVDTIINIIAGDSTTSTTPQINVTTIASTTTLTSTGHTLAVGDAVIPRVSANGLVAGRKYWVAAIATNTFTLAATYGGAAITTFTNGTGLDIDLETIDYPTATNSVTSTTALITAAQTLDAAQETIAQNVIDDLNAVAWHTDFVVDDTSLTSTDFRIYVGKHTLVHTYVSGGTVTKANGTTLSITGFNYNNSTGYAVVTTATHGLAAGDIVDITNITVSCLSVGTGGSFTSVFPSATKTDGVTPKIRYIQHKCIRDVRLITEAVMFDFMFNSNFQTIKAAYSYLRASAAEVFTGDQKTITRDAFANAKTEALANVGGNATAQSRIETLMTLLDDIVYGATNEGSICQTDVRNADWARLQLERNRAYIVSEITAYIEATYTTTVTAVTATSDVFTCADTSWMQRNAAIRFTGTLFSGSGSLLSSNTTYYIQNVVSSTTFTIATSRNSNTPLNIITNDTGSMTVSLYYPVSECERDVNAYIDALKFDLMYPGNYKSRLAARYYANAVTGSLEEDMYYLRNGTGIRNQTLQGLTGDLLAENDYGTRRVSAGAYCSLDPGWGPDDFRTWIIGRSPYVQNVATFGYAAIGQKIDGALHNGGNDSIVSNDFTQIISDGIGAWVTNNGRAELVSVFTYYAHIGYLSENGGRIRGTNGNNSYGDFGSVAEGFDATETPIYCEVDNTAYRATVGSVITDGVDKIWQFEYDNAGTDYTELSWTVSGGGAGASTEQTDYRDGAVFQIRLLDNVDDSTTAPESDGNFGGSGYISNANTAQSGTLTQLTLAATDDEITGAYVGMKLIITSGAGAGQVGIVSAFTAGTKIATVIKESTGASGWDHLVPGTAIAAPDASSTYIVEPRVTFTGPTYSSTARTLATAQTYTDATYAPVFAVYTPVTTTTSGSGLSATFTVVRKGTKYSAVNIVAAGTNYERLDTVTISGTSLGGASTTNDVTITVTAINSTTGAITAFEYVGVGAGGRFVAVSSGSRTTNTSVNGTAWSENLLALPSTSNWTSLAAGKLTVVETAGAFVTGRSYVITSLGNTVFTSIGADANLVGQYFVATGAGSGTGTATPIASHLVAVSSSTTVNAYSTNGGVTWTAGGALPGGLSGLAVGVAYGKYSNNGRWVVLGSGGTTAYSSNGGVTWTAGGSLAAGTWTSIAYGQGAWIAVSTGGTATSYSTDGGVTWTAGGALPTSSSWISITYGANKFVAVSSDGTVNPAYSVNKGVTWSNTDAAGYLGTGTITNVHYGQGVFVVTTSSSNNMSSSEDGLNWTTRAITRASGTGALTAIHGNPSQSGIWAIIPSASTTAASSAVIGATAKARVFVSDTKIYAIRITDPGSAYAAAPTITITDPNNLYEAPTQVRIGNGACANVSFINRGTGFDSAIVEQDTGDGYANTFQSGKFMGVRRLTGIPRAGANVVFATQPNTVYKLVQVLSDSGTFDGARSAFFQLSPEMAVFNSPADGTSITTRVRYSQVRLTGHDFLDIGTGNFVETNYPGIPTQVPIPANETVDNNGGRCFYTSTDQDGNFRVGELFSIEQSTGVATLNADAFNIAGLSELSLGNITLGGNSATVTEFSTDPFLTANSDNVVPTQRAIRAYISAQIGGGGAALNVNSLVAGFIEIAGTRISTTTGGTIQMKANFNFQAGVRGYPVAWNYFLNN
jgi:hypothetical protein